MVTLVSKSASGDPFIDKLLLVFMQVGEEGALVDAPSKTLKATGSQCFPCSRLEYHPLQLVSSSGWREPNKHAMVIAGYRFAGRLRCSGQAHVGIW